MPPAGLAATARCPGGYGIRPYAVGVDACIDSEPRRLPHVAFLGPLCEGAPPAGGGGENLFPGDYDYIRQGRGHNVCFDLTAAPAGDFSLAFDGGLTLAYADADRTCCLTFTDDAMSGGRTSRYVKLDAP